MMLPPPRSRMCGSAAWARNNGARRLTAIMRSHSSSRISETVRSNMIPALLTRMSIPPNRSTACSTAVAIDDGDAEIRLDVGDPRVARQRVVQRLALDDRHLAPSSRKRSTMPRPIPRPPPVTSGDLSFELHRYSSQLPTGFAPVTSTVSPAM